MYKIKFRKSMNKKISCKLMNKRTSRKSMYLPQTNEQKNLPQTNKQKNLPQTSSPFFAWLGRIGGVLAVLTAFVYTAGFIALTSHYKILGIHSAQIPAQQYLESGGLFIAVVFQAFIPGSQNLILQNSDPAYNISGMNWGQPWVSRWWTIGTCLLLWAVIYWLLSKKTRNQCFKIILELTAFLGVILAIFFAGTLISLESEVLRLHSCLQSFDAQAYGKVSASFPIKPPKPDMPDFGNLQTQVQKSVGKLIISANQKHTPHFARLFALEYEHGYELPRLMTFFRLVWMAGITLAIVFFFGWLTKGRMSRVFKITFQILLASQLIFLSAGYGIMGKEYLYPAVKTDYKYNNKIVSDFPVIMLMNNDKETIIYDRINLMQIKRIPKSAILKIEQFFLVSPFSNCSDDIDPEKFIPCEIQAVPH